MHNDALEAPTSKKLVKSINSAKTSIDDEARLPLAVSSKMKSSCTVSH